MDATNNPTATTNTPLQRRSTFDNHIPAASTTTPPFDVSCRRGLIWDSGGGEFIQSASVGVDAANNPTATTIGPHQLRSSFDGSIPAATTVPPFDTSDLGSGEFFSAYVSDEPLLDKKCQVSILLIQKFIRFFSNVLIDLACVPKISPSCATKDQNIHTNHFGLGRAYTS